MRSVLESLLTLLLALSASSGSAEAQEASAVSGNDRPAGACQVGKHPVQARPLQARGQPLLDRRSDGNLQFGFNDHAWYERRLTLAQDRNAHRIVGSSVLRWTLLWGQIERRRGSYDWAPTDEMYCNALAGGLRPVLVLTSSPRWSVASTAGCSPGGHYCQAPPRRGALRALTRFARAVAIRYPRAAAVEAWNEPNLDAFWRYPNPRYYAAVLRAIHRGARLGNPGLPVIAGNLGVDRRGIDPVVFLRTLYRARGRRSMDALGLHPYPDLGETAGPADRFHRTLRAVRQLIAERDPERRLWINELGVTRLPEGGYQGWQRQRKQQGAYYDELNGASDVDVVIFHTLIDESGYGWLRRRGGKIWAGPAYCAFAERFGTRPLVCPGPLWGSAGS